MGRDLESAVSPGWERDSKRKNGATQSFFSPPSSSSPSWHNSSSDGARSSSGGRSPDHLAHHGWDGNSPKLLQWRSHGKKHDPGGHEGPTKEGGNAGCGFSSLPHGWKKAHTAASLAEEEEEEEQGNNDGGRGRSYGGPLIGLKLGKRIYYEGGGDKPVGGALGGGDKLAVGGLWGRNGLVVGGLGPEVRAREDGGNKLVVGGLGGEDKPVVATLGPGIRAREGGNKLVVAGLGPMARAREEEGNKLVVASLGPGVPSKEEGGDKLAVDGLGPGDDKQEVVSGLGFGPGPGPGRGLALGPPQPPPSRRARLGNGSVAVRPRCQVEGCQADLSSAKDYHRRHKVCDLHSKAPKVTVASVEQRFCQQCSRFHVLMEFDESKRSCRRRLAGHNERRRKPQPDPLAMRLPAFLDDRQFGQIWLQPHSLQFTPRTPSMPSLWEGAELSSKRYWGDQLKSETHSMLNHSSQSQSDDTVSQRGYPYSQTCPDLIGQGLSLLYSPSGRGGGERPPPLNSTLESSSLLPVNQGIALVSDSRRALSLLSSQNPPWSSHSVSSLMDLLPVTHSEIAFDHHFTHPGDPSSTTTTTVTTTTSATTTASPPLFLQGGQGFGVAPYRMLSVASSNSQLNAFSAFGGAFNSCEEESGGGPSLQDDRATIDLMHLSSMPTVEPSHDRLHGGFHPGPNSYGLDLQGLRPFGGTTTALFDSQHLM